MAKTQKWEVWTHAEFISDEDLLDHWEGWMHRIANTVARTYKLTPEDKADIIGDFQLKLLKLPQNKRPLIGYTRMLFNNCVRSSIDQIKGSGGSRAHWRNYSTVDYSTAFAGSANEEAAGFDALNGVVVNEGTENRAVLRATFEKAFHYMPERDVQVVRLYYGINETNEELTIGKISEKMGVTPTTVSNTLKRSNLRLKKLLL